MVDYKLRGGSSLFFEYEKDSYPSKSMRLLKLKIIVEYERTVFADFPGNVRVTYDRNIYYSDKLDKIC